MRLYWIDLMKALAMFFVIWGHCFPDAMSSFIYAFNVPVFFIMSGYLVSKSSDNFYRKLFTGLMVPYLILAFIKAAGAIVKGFGSGDAYITILGVLGGFHSVNDVQGCSNLWFVYSLIIIRLIHHFIHSRHILIISAVLLCVFGSWMLPQYTEMPKWAVSDVLLALPMFYIGYYSKTQWGKYINLLSNAPDLRMQICATIVFCMTAACILVIAHYNGTVGMYAGNFGNNLGLYYLGAIVGTIMCWAMALIINSKSRVFNIIALGNIVTLTFHRELLHSPLKAIVKSDMVPWLKEISMAGLSIAVLVCFIPICWLIIKYLPILVGKRHK